MSQLLLIVSRYENQIPEGFEGAQEDALLEAGLMHVSALDDFLRPGQGDSRGRPPDIRATDWLPGKWQTSYWLDPRVRSQIEWQVIHISSMSGMEFPPFNVAHIAAALCDEIERFFAAVEEHCDAERLAAFGDARSIAIAARPNFARYL